MEGTATVGVRLQCDHGADRPLEGEANGLASQASSPPNPPRRENTELFRLGSRPKFWLAVLGCGLSTVFVDVLEAQDEVAHEYVPDLRSSETLTASEGPVPAAIVYRGEILPAPSERRAATGRASDDGAARVRRSR